MFNSCFLIEFGHHIQAFAFLILENLQIQRQDSLGGIQISKISEISHWCYSLIRVLVSYITETTNFLIIKTEAGFIDWEIKSSTGLYNPQYFLFQYLIPAATDAHPSPHRKLYTI